MKLGVVAFLTDRGLGICDMARQIENAGLESLFVVQNTHVPVSGTALLEVEHHERDHHFLDPFVALGAAAAILYPSGQPFAGPRRRALPAAWSDVSVAD